MNSPVNFNDPTGHVPECDDGPQTWAACKKQLTDFANRTIKKLSGKNDLEAVVKIVDKAAQLYKNYDNMIPALSGVFLGIEESNPFTVYHAAKADRCAAIGREPKDCTTNPPDQVFWDQGFNPNYQDGHSQAFHFWAYVATTASTDSPGSYLAGRHVGNVANFAHEILAIPNDKGGATWQDYALSQKAMDIGFMIATQQIAPNQLGNYIKEQVGTNSKGAPWVQIFIKHLPLQGN